MSELRDIDYILNLEISDFIGLYIKTLEKKQEERLFREWVVQVPYMDKNSYTPFSKYLDSCLQSNKNIISDKEIIKELEEVVKQFKGR